MRYAALLIPTLLVAAACDTVGPTAVAPAGPDALVFETGEFTVPAGSERFLCWTWTLPEDLVITSFDYQARPVVHHLAFTKTLKTEPDGFSECEVLFRPTWQPLFGAGSGSASLELPADTAHTLPAGTQLLVQLHLLNASHEDVTDRVAVTVQTAQDLGARTVGMPTFGETWLELPPNQASDAVFTCELLEDVEMFAALPHMHYLGHRLTFEVGHTLDALTEVYRRDPYDFDDQYIDPLELTLKAGSWARVTCSFDNPYDHPVGFGESSLDEMCFLIAYAKDKQGFADVCRYLEAPEVDPTEPVDPVDPGAGMCGEHEPTSTGVGLPCTKGGGECPAPLLCTADQSDEGEVHFCMALGCDTDADCGGAGATCCAPAEAGGLINVCLPEACRPSDCVRSSVDE